MYFSLVIHLNPKPPLLKVGLHTSPLEALFFNVDGNLCLHFLPGIKGLFLGMQVTSRSRTPVECVNPKSRGWINRAPPLEQLQCPSCTVHCRLTVLTSLYAIPSKVQWSLCAYHLLLILNNPHSAHSVFVF